MSSYCHAGVADHFFVACGAFGQSSAPAFEVASVKPSDGHFGIDMKTFPKRLTSTCNVHRLIEAAYSVERWQVTGGPTWLDTDLFGIEAKTSEDLSGETDRVLALGRPAPRKMMLMLQTLLAERFNLKVHRETRQDNVFTLVVAKGPKLQAPKDTTRSFIRWGRNGSPQAAAISYWMEGSNASMAQLAHALEGNMHRPVTDQTGLPGNYDFRLEYGDDSASGDAPAFLTALQDATGLKLNTAKGPVGFLVVDRADKPSAN